MKAQKVAAQFAAYTWYQENRGGKDTRDEAIRFARENWTAFLCVANEGWGRLLIRLGSTEASRQDKRVRRRNRSLAG